MDKNIFNNLLSNVDTLQTRLRSYNSFKNEIERTKADLEATAETIRNMITEDET